MGHPGTLPLVAIPVVALVYVWGDCVRLNAACVCASVRLNQVNLGHPGSLTLSALV